MLCSYFPFFCQLTRFSRVTTNCMVLLSFQDPVLDTYYDKAPLTGYPVERGVIPGGERGGGSQNSSIPHCHILYIIKNGGVTRG